MNIKDLLDPFPVLVTRRLRLRRIMPHDAPEIFFLRSHPDLMRYTGVAPMTTIDESYAYIQLHEERRLTGSGIAWGITLTNESAVMGILGFRKLDAGHFRGEVGYGLHPDLHGKGMADEALKAILAFGFQTLGLHSIEANVDKDNAPSIRLLERNLFVREAHFKENFYFEGRFIDSVIYSLLAPPTEKYLE